MVWIIIRLWHCREWHGMVFNGIVWYNMVFNGILLNVLLAYMYCMAGKARHKTEMHEK